MFKYAQIDDNGVCISISYLTGEKESPNFILLTEEENVNLRDKYDNGVWIPAMPPEPQGPTLQEQLEQLKVANELLGQQVVDRELDNLMLQMDNEVLGQQLVAIELRLMEGGL